MNKQKKITKKIGIIGGGIAGLTVANFLEFHKIPYKIYESSIDYNPKGLGIWLGINAMQVFRKIKIADKIYTKGKKLSYLNLIDDRGKILNNVNLKSIIKTDENVVCLMRKDLQKILLENIPKSRFIMQKKLINLYKTNKKTNVFFQDGNKIELDAVIGCDGINSHVRKSIFPLTKLTENSKVCFRGISNINLSPPFLQSGNEVWSSGSLFGFCEISKDHIFWWGVKKRGKNSINSINTIKDVSLLFSNFPSIVKSIISATTSIDNIHITALPNLDYLNSYYKNNICLVGDSATAMLPNLGQGGSIAIESAYYLSKIIIENTETDFEIIFKRYNNFIKPKTSFVKRSSSVIALLSEIETKILAKIRNVIIKVTPKLISNLGLKKIYKLMN